MKDERIRDPALRVIYTRILGWLAIGPLQGFDRKEGKR